MTGSDSPGDADFPMRRPDVEWVALDGETVLYDPKEHMMHWLNATAAAVWAECDGTTSTEQVVHTIEADYSGQRSEIEQGVAAIIGRFRHQGLLQPTPTEGGADR